MSLSDVKALTFDVFGTVVDWRSSLIREGEQLGQSKGIEVDWAEFADRWRGGYGPAMARVRSGESALDEDRRTASYDPRWAAGRVRHHLPQ